MATRVKTIEFWFPAGTTLVDNTDTNLTQITLYRPETVGSNPFKSVFAECIVHDRNTTLGGINRHQVSIQLGSAGYSVVDNANAITNAGEQQTILFTGDFTSYFNTNWSGTSMTCDCKILMDSAVASPLNPSFNNVTVRIVMTYEYDDTSTTQIKTVRIPLNCPVGAMGTTKPGTAVDTIPALDTELPEASKTYRQTVLVLQGNDNGSNTDLTFNMQVDTNTAFASATYEHGSNVAMFYRNISIESFTTNATHGFYVWCSSAVGNHCQSWLVVTYEFDASASNDCFVSMMLPVALNSPLGGTTDTDYQRATISLFIEEPATITTKQLAFYMFWDQQGTISGLNFRIGTGSFVTYTDAASVVAGSNAAMIRNDSAFTLARGLNTFNVDSYRTDTSDLGYTANGFFIINYTCGKPTKGYGASNRTISWLINDSGTDAVATEFTHSNINANFTETDYFINCFGVSSEMLHSSSGTHGGWAMGIERLSSGEGGLKWERVFSDLTGVDGETGIYHSYSNVSIFRRFETDFDSVRLNFKTNRRWRTNAGGAIPIRPTAHMLITMHNITFTVGADVSGSNGGTVNLYLHDYSTGERMASTSRSGNGAYSFDWFDNTRDMIVSAWESNTVIGLSGKGTATGSP